MKKIHFFNRHLTETGENYFEHFIFASTTALWIFGTSIILITHAIFPCIFTTTSSSNIKKINERMQKRVAVLTERRNQKNFR